MAISPAGGEPVYVVVDTETTGGPKWPNRITEIAAVKLVGGEIVDRFSTLVNPGRSIPYRITELTGITNSMVVTAPPMAEVLPKFLEFLGDGVFVAHNAPFDRSFVNLELGLAGLPPMPNPVLCTCRLARRLLPQLRSKSLDALTLHYGIKIRNRHRAMGDAEATAHVLSRLMGELSGQGVGAAEQVLGFQHKKKSEIVPSAAHLTKLRETVLPKLPHRPGVYLMKSRSGEILYVGKAKALRDRVGSYFAAPDGLAPKVRELMGKVRDIAWEETPSELSALMLESRLIKAMQPRYNTLIKRYRTYPFIRLDVSAAYPTLGWSSEILPDGAEYYGPFGGRRSVETVIDTIGELFRLRSCDDGTLHGAVANRRPCLFYDLGRCTAPCRGDEARAAYLEEVERVRRFLSGGDEGGLIAELEAHMAALADEMRFEDAAALRDKIRDLKKVVYRQSRIAASINEHHLLLLQPTADPTRAELFFIRHGRLHAQAVIDVSGIDGLREVVETVYFSGAEAPPHCRKEEIDEMRILANWVWRYRSRGTHLYITTNHATPDDVLTALRTQLPLALAAPVEPEDDPF